jgi:hypothetical protein
LIPYLERMNCSQCLPDAGRPPAAPHGAPGVAWTMAAWWCLLLGGCAALTNPVANSVPVRLVPEELLTAPKEALAPIPLTWLRRRPPDVHRLAPGDVLGIYIEGVLGSTDQIPPVYFPETPDQMPAMGYPFPVSDDGSVSLPLVGSLPVEGLTIDEAQKVVERAYTEQQQILQRDQLRLIVSLIRPRYARITVVREDTPERREGFVAGYGIGILTRPDQLVEKREPGTGHVVEIPAGEADVLGALTRTGGLPGPNAANEVIVLRGYRDIADADEAMARARDPDAGPLLLGAQPHDGSPGAIRIPLRWPPGVAPPFRPQDVALESGDIILVPGLDAQVYYTGGILPSREVPLPRDYDINAVEAVLRVGGPLLNGGINTSQFTDVLVPAGIGRPSPSLLTVIRRTPGGQHVAIRVDLNRAVRDARENILIQAGDILILQETPAEAVARYFTQTFGFGHISRLYNRGSATGTATASVP